MGYKCEFSYRKKGDVKIYCTTPQMKEWGLCGCQYYCSNSLKYELSNLSQTCSIRKKNQTEENKK